MLSINWRRGLFRIWIAASFVWLVGAGAVWQKDIRQDVSRLMTAEIQTVTDPTTLMPWERNWEEAPRVGETVYDRLQARLIREEWARRVRAAPGKLMVAASVLLLPPILAFALGWAGLWIVRGFRS